MKKTHCWSDGKIKKILVRMNFIFFKKRPQKEMKNYRSLKIGIFYTAFPILPTRFMLQEFF